VQEGRLILVTEGTYRTGLASEYDLPEFLPAPTATPEQAQQSDGRACSRPDRPPPYTQTPGGLIELWRWCPRRREWLDYGACRDVDAANAVVGRHMSRRSEVWSVGDERRSYTRGRGLRVTPWRFAPGKGG
jgi:hypothetical protein